MRAEWPQAATGCYDGLAILGRSNTCRVVRQFVRRLPADNRPGSHHVKRVCEDCEEGGGNDGHVRQQGSERHYGHYWVEDLPLPPSSRASPGQGGLNLLAIVSSEVYFAVLPLLLIFHYFPSFSSYSSQTKHVFLLQCLLILHLPNILISVFIGLKSDHCLASL